MRVADVSADYAVLGEPTRAPGLEGEPVTWVDPWPGPVGDTASDSDVDPHPGLERPWRELIVPRAQLEAVVGDRPLAGLWAAQALRVAAWRPRADREAGSEGDARTLPHEVDWLRTEIPRLMAGVAQLQVPLLAEVGVGQNWDEAH